ncbi:MAG: ATP-dependent RNA helicase HrpA, partial [Spirochaetaceae bacterium 4572_59]
QRKGRCGRIENGICIRLYTEEDFNGRQEFTPAEILRTNLAEVILRMLSLRLDDPSKFPFIDPPTSAGISDGYKTLQELGAVKTAGGGKSRRYEMTGIGRIMASFPLDPRLARMLLEADKEHCLEDVLVIASSLNVHDPRERSADKPGSAEQAHAKFRHDESDFLTMLNIWRSFENNYDTKKAGHLRKYCKENYLSFRRMREWQDIYRQIKILLEEKGYKVRPYQGNEENFYPAIHRSILSGFLSHIALKKEKVYYRATRNRELMIFPGSGLFKDKRAKEWIVAGEIVKTSKLFGRIVANIDSEWLCDLGAHLMTATYHTPVWSQDKGAVMAMEQKRLYGFIIQEGMVPYGPINPGESTDIFIRSALIEGMVKDPSEYPFLQKNRELIDSIVNMENKIRCRNLMVSDEELFLIYKSRLEDIYDLGLLEQLIRDKGEEALLITEKDLLAGNTDNLDLEQFPDQLSFGNVEVSVEYSFEPGDETDGVTVQVPALEAMHVDAAKLDWAIPGLHRERIAALIKGLPKNLRKKLTPVNATVDEILNNMPQQDDTRLTRVLSEYIYREWGLSISLDDWDEEALPDHLKIRIAVTDEKGAVIEAARDSEVLYKKYKANIDKNALRRCRKEWERSGIKRWDFGDLPEELSLKGKGGLVFKVFPVLKDCAEDYVALVLMEDRDGAEETHQKGLARLIRNEFAKEVRNFKKELSVRFPFGDGSTYFGGVLKMEGMIWQRIFLEAASKQVWKEQDFRALLSDLAPRLYNIASDYYEQAALIVSEFRDTRLFLSQVEKKRGASGMIFIEQRREDLKELVPEDFLVRYPSERIRQLVRYMKLIRIRSEKGNLDPGKDREREAAFLRYWNRYEKILKNLPEWISQARRETVVAMWWYLQEYKIFLFAQEMKTKEKVSTERVERRLDKLQAML